MRFFIIAKTLLKSLFTKPATVKYPFGPRQYHKGTRGQVLIDVKACIFCGICQRKCPTNAILVERTGKKWTIQRMRCISCGACVDVCPKKCLALDNQYSAPGAVKKEDSYHNA